MGSNAVTVARNIRLFRDRTLAPQALSALLAAAARRERDATIARGDAPKSFQTFVDGRAGAAEETVRPDGAILYRFNLMGPAVLFALGYVIGRSPVRSGAFRNSWIVVVNGAKWTADLNDIPIDATVIVTNPLPYARKIETGHMKMSVPHGIVEEARQQVRRRYPVLEVEKQMVLIPRSMGGGYVLRGRFRRGARPNARKKLASDTKRGSVMTYPALQITTRR
jgi:hypothetical protein